MATNGTNDGTKLLIDSKPGHGVKEDFNVFLHHFTEKNTLRYEDFSEIWKELRMSYLFAGMVEYELREAIQYAFQCGVEIFNSTTKLQSKTCAIYFLYAVYETQALYPRAKIRVTVSQFSAFSKFVEEMADKQHYDFVFVFTRLRMERAFQCVATALSQGRRKKRLNNLNKTKELLPTSLVSGFSDISLDLVEDLAVVNEEYYRVKCVATSSNPGGGGHSATPHPSLDLAKPYFIQDLTRQLARFDTWRKTGRWKKKPVRKKGTGASGGVTTSESEGENLSDSDSAAEVGEETIAVKRQKIREKAYGTLSETRRSSRYRRMVGDSSQSDGGGAGSSSTRRKVASSRPPTTSAAALVVRDATEIAETNAHLMAITAPSKMQQRRWRNTQRQARRDREKNAEESQDSDDSSVG